MGQQPNIELLAGDRPKGKLQRGAERRWAPRRPGEITSPADMPSGGSFGRPGPDTGWGLQMIRGAVFDRGRRPGDVESLLSALVAARASRARRGPTWEDVDVALSLLGLHEDYGVTGEAVDRMGRTRERWLDALAHDPWPGRSALATIPGDLLDDEPARVRARLLAEPALVG